MNKPPGHKRSLLVVYTDGISDPPSRQAAISLAAAGFEHLTLHIPTLETAPPPEFSVVNFKRRQLPRPLRALQQAWNWLRYRALVHQTIREFEPDVVVTIMHHALAALPAPSGPKRFQRVSCIYDIPALEDAGQLDRRIIQRGWQRLKTAGTVWASDIFKARLAQDLGQLTVLPLVCHNCPPLDYLPEPTQSRDGWLRAELRKQGATIGDTGGSILLRAGAVGECGGIEETLAGMRALPEDYVFVMLGRPPEAYKRQLLQQIADLGLQRRALLFDRPSDAVWKQSLQGADIGHLIHGPFPPGRMTRLYELNSSLSNNRLFQYMAAGLPILAYDDPRMNELYAEVPCFRVARLARLADDILTAWHELGASFELRAQLGRAGRSAYLAKYCWEVQFAPVSENLLGQAR